MKSIRTLLFAALLLTSFSCFAAIGYSRVDRMAKTLPTNDAQSVDQIAKYITDNFKSDEEKARFIAVFIAYQFDKDGYTAKKLMEASLNNKKADAFVINEPLKTRIGTPGDFADLFQQIARAVNIEAVTIRGYAGREIPRDRNSDPAVKAFDNIKSNFDLETDNYLQRFQSSWNAVKIGDKWQLIDTYWMARGDIRYGSSIRNDTEMETELKRRATRLPSTRDLTASKVIDNNFFFAEPNFFAKTHYPLDSEWQLLDRPISWERFVR